MSVDPLAPDYPELTTYQFASNSPISGIDLDGLEFYYSADGTLIGKLGTDQSVRVVKSEDIAFVDVSIQLANEYSEMPSYGFNKGMADGASTDVGLTHEELNTRVTLTVIRIAEHGNKPDKAPLAYNRRYGSGKTFSDYSKHPNIAYSGPGYRIKSTAAGAYQFLYSSWQKIESMEGLDDFSPESQDKGALNLIRRQETYNPRASGVLNNIRQGEVLEALDKLHGTWTSLPGGSQEKITPQEAPKIINDVRAKELKGESVIATEDLDDL